jgi:tetratricopeptide (TPR) repeat protein
MVREIERQNQHLNANFFARPGNLEVEANLTTSSVNLTDADYEFLFGQLLEGVAYGWHQGKIVKFFQQLGVKGNSEAWVAWLGRFGKKLASVSDVSRRELATNTMRFGEIARSSPEIQSIGTKAYQIGEQLLFGERPDLIWEYSGLDLPLNPKIESERDTQVLLQIISEEGLANTSLADKIIEDLRPSVTESSIIQDKPLDRNNQSKDTTEQSYSAEAKIRSDPFSQNNQSKDTTKSSPSTLPTEEEHELTALTWQQFISLIQQDEDLVKQISKKLNISATDPDSIADAAIAKLKTIEQNDKHRSTSELLENWFNLGLKQASAGEFSSAIASWEKALELNPNLSEAWHNRGSALGRLGRYREAIESFERALAIAPNNDRAWNDRAHALYQLQLWQEAATSWDKASAIAPGNHLFWYNRGCALEQLKKIEESILSYEKALEIKPDFHPARSRYISLVANKS